MRKTTKSLREEIVKDIQRATRKHYSSEEKIRILVDGLCGEDSIAELCCREGISASTINWSKDFIESGKRRLAGDMARTATTDDVKYLRQAQIPIKQWRIHYNTVRPQSVLRHRLAAPETMVPVEQKPPGVQKIKLDHLMGADQLDNSDLTLRKFILTW